jgi:hypothetical protein
VEKGAVPRGIEHLSQVRIFDGRYGLSARFAPAHVMFCPRAHEDELQKNAGNKRSQTVLHEALEWRIGIAIRLMDMGSGWVDICD